MKKIALMIALLAMGLGAGALAPNALPSKSMSVPASVSASAAPIADFRPDRAEAVLSRAEAVLKENHSVIGFRSDLPLVLVKVQTGELSAQVYYAQHIQGRVVLPRSGVKVDLGAKGELLGLDSDYDPHLMAEGEFRLSLEQAREKAQSALEERTENLANIPKDIHDEIQGGTQVFWAASARAVPAYVFSSRGREVVVQGESGEILDFKDRRAR